MQITQEEPSIKHLQSKIAALTAQLKGVELSEAEKAALQKIKALRDDLSCIFEWHDGILVESMQSGGLLLIDEISLANDSVLERLNSVFEADRTLMISEKSSKEAVKVVGHENFKMVATMNPSGDFGKKELSPALRNRMTEIWVESYFQQDQLLALYKTPTTIFEEVPHSIDLYLIIEQTAVDKLRPLMAVSEIKRYALGIFNMIGFINFTMAARYFALSRKSLSIRDILSMIDFVQVTIQGVFKNEHSLAFRHAIELVIIDGLCLGIDVAGDKQKSEILSQCQDYMGRLESALFGQQVSI